MDLAFSPISLVENIELSFIRPNPSWIQPVIISTPNFITVELNTGSPTDEQVDVTSLLVFGYPIDKINSIDSSNAAAASN